MSEHTIDRALVEARPRALAALSRFFRDLDRAEDAFQEACLRALRHWPEKGVPHNPAAWLAMVGRNAGIDAVRRGSRQEALEESRVERGGDSRDEIELGWIESLDHRSFSDDVLRLLFTCCHPTLKPEQQIALALKVVAGLSVDAIASAFLIPRKTLEQRITRAKRKVASARIPYSSPQPAERRQRLAAVSRTLYLLFNEGYAASGGEALIRRPLCDEALRLLRLLAELFPDEVEVEGLLALCLLQDARRDARVDADGELVLLDDQDRGRWNRAQSEEGRRRLEWALRQRRPGPYQVQAAIAAVHSSAADPAATDWAEIDRLYAVLESLQPTPVVTLNRAVAVAKVRGPKAALEHLERVAQALAGSFHFHGVRGALLAEAGDAPAARRELEQALVLARTPAERRHLEDRLEEVAAKAPQPTSGPIQAPVG